MIGGPEKYNREEKAHAMNLPTFQEAVDYWGEVLAKKLKLGEERHRAHKAAKEYEEAGEPKGGAQD